MDVLVLGLGAMGSAALYHLAKRGAAPVGVEQFEIDHPYGASFGRSRAFRTFYPDPLYAQLARAALPLWRDLERQSGESLLTLCGTLYFGRPGHPGFEQSIRVADELGLGEELLTPANAARRFPVLSLAEESTVCFVPESGFLDPSRAVRAHVRLAAEAGAEVHDQTAVLDVDLRADEPVVRTESTTFVCSRLVITPGPWAMELLAELELPLRVTRQEKFYFRPLDPRGFGPGSLPVFSDFDTELYGFPMNGPGVKVADDHPGPETSPRTIDRRLAVSEQERLHGWLTSLMPSGSFAFAEGTTCMYSLTPDRDFLIGPHPANPAVIVGAGFSGHGFKFSTLVGLILAELATRAATSYPIARFRLDRFTGGRAQ